MRLRRSRPRRSTASATSTPAPQAPPAEIPEEAAAHGAHRLPAAGSYRSPAAGASGRGPAARGPRTRDPLRGIVAGPAHPDAGCWLLGEPSRLSRNTAGGRGPRGRTGEPAETRAERRDHCADRVVWALHRCIDARGKLALCFDLTGARPT